MAKLYLQRHLKSQWNEENSFAGWTDGPLTKDSDNIAKEFAKEVLGVKIDKAYCSVQFRSMDTLASIFDNIPEKYPMFVHIDGGNMQKWGRYLNEKPNELKVFTTEKLNERCYGKLQGLNKKETAEKYGEEQVRLWRRSYDVAPPAGESLKDVCKRVHPFYKKYIEKDLKDGKDVLVVASHNSLRAIVKYIEKISDEDVASLELPFGALIRYDFSEGEYKKFA
jgi:2,3-bisphosphoglycerate-dependent phosphoglycerate mutase